MSEATGAAVGLKRARGWDGDEQRGGAGPMPAPRRLGADGHARVCGCESMPVAGETTHVRRLVVAEHGAA
jgi:hypothetical protein